MKRPASVTSAIVVLGVMIVICAISTIAGLAKGTPLTALPGILFAAIHITPIIALVGRKNWGRIFAILVFALWAVCFLCLGIYMIVKFKSWPGLIIELMISGLLVWQISALLREEAKSYFSNVTVPMQGA